MLFHSHMIGRWYQVRGLWQNSFRVFVIFLSRLGIDLFERLFAGGDISIQFHGSQQSVSVQKFWNQRPDSHFGTHAGQGWGPVIGPLCLHFLLT